MADEIFSKDVLADVVHDLKSPLSAVRGYLELIQQAGELNPAQTLYCGRALTGLDRMELLIANLLDMVRLESDIALDFVDCDMEKVVYETVELVESLADQRGIRFHVEVEDNLSLIRGDVQLLRQVMNNLLTNAIKYNRQAGEVYIQVSNQPEFIRVDVRDTGVGIPQDDQAYVFDRFFRARNSAQARVSGNGLGLAIVKAIIQKHEGYIWLQSEENEGSVFSFTLPRKVQRSEGGDSTVVQPYSIYDEHSLEESDDIDDNMQESRGSSEIDSSNDVV